MMPTQARDSCSFGEKAWLHVLLSHPRAGTSSPPGMPDLQGLAPVPALLSSVCHGSAGSVVVQCPEQGFCGSGVPTLLLSLLGWCRRGWIEGLGVLLVPAGGQFGAACALSSTALLLDVPVQSPWLPRGPAGAWLLSSFSSRQFGISSVQRIFEPWQGLLSLSLSCVDIMTNNEQ